MDNPYDIAKSFLNKTETRDREELREFFKIAKLKVDPAKTPWCAAFVNACLASCGIKGTGLLTARSFLKFGKKTDTPQKGDIVVFKRGNSAWQGHVGFYVKETGTGILTLGGNQSNKVCYQVYSKTSLLGYREVEKKPCP